MNAKPVKVGRKIIGWSCGVCGYVDCASRVVHGREKTRMEECCVCATCKAPITTGGPSTQCGACRDKERTERESATTTERALDVWSWEDALKEHDAAWRFRLQSGTTGRVLLSPMHGGVFSGGYARLDPTEDDPDPRIASETLQRSEMRAVFDAVLTLTAHTDDLIESFVLEDRNGPALDSSEADQIRLERERHAEEITRLTASIAARDAAVRTLIAARRAYTDILDAPQVGDPEARTRAMVEAAERAASANSALVALVEGGA